MDMRKLVGRNALRIRLKKGLTQEEFAEQSGFSQQYISGLERGRRNPTVVTVFELALALGVNYLELLQPPGDDDEPSTLEGEATSQKRMPRPRRAARRSSRRT
jgi:transcriptional regulator with XRE-family HTH domain